MRQFFKPNQGAALGVVAIGITLILWALDHEVKSLSVELTKSVNLQLDTPSDDTDIKVLISDEPVPDPYLTTIDVINDGNQPIVSSDFEGPITLVTPSQSIIIRAYVNHTSPENLPVKVEFKDRKITLHPLLLNANDRISIAVLSSGQILDISTQSRISGITTVDFNINLSPVRGSPDVSLTAGLILMALFIYARMMSQMVRSGGLAFARAVALILMLFVILQAQPILEIPIKYFGPESEETRKGIAYVLIFIMALIAVKLTNSGNTPPTDQSDITPATAKT